MKKQEVYLRYYANGVSKGFRTATVTTQEDVLQWMKTGLSNMESYHVDHLTVGFKPTTFSKEPERIEARYDIKTTESGFVLTPHNGGKTLHIERHFDEEAFLRDAQRRAIVSDAFTGLRSLFARK